MNNIKWIGLKEKEITDEHVQQVEKYLGIKFPNDFINCIKKYDGGYPLPHTFNIQGQGADVFNKLLTFDLESKHSILQVYEDVKDRLINKIYPFARDPFGNLLCFDYRNDPQSPTVVFWDHEEEEVEEAIFPVCSSFTELLDSLYEFEDEDE